MKQFYVFRNSFLCPFLILFLFSNFQIQAFSSNNFFNDGGTVTASQTVMLNQIPATLIETAAPNFAGPYEYLWMVSIPSDPVLNVWTPILGATNSDFTFTGPLSVTSLYTRCVRLAGTNDDYVETNVVMITVLNSLPIDLVSFNAVDNENGTVQLNWITASERNNEYFQLESSVDGLDFKVLERMEGALNSEDLKSYTYRDDSPNFGNNYYRLKQVDTNGDFEYSDIISIKITNGFGHVFSIFPNPVSQELNIKINTPLNNKGQVEIINTMGQVVFQSDSISTPFATINLNGLAIGTYFIKILDNDIILFQDKIVKID